VKLKSFFLVLLFGLMLSMAGKAKVATISEGAKIISLENENWELYYGKTYQDLVQEGFNDPENCIVPGSWGSSMHSELGYGTYVSRLIWPNAKGKQFAIHLRAIGTNYQLFVNGFNIATAGTFGKVKEKSIPDYKPGIFVFVPESDTLEIAIQIANFHYRQGGLWYAPEIGLQESISGQFHFELIYLAFLCGALGVLFFYFLGFYYTKTKDKTCLYFSLVCLFSSLRIASTGEILLKQIAPSIPFEIIVRIEFASLVFIVLFGLVYFYSFYPRDVNKKILKGFVFLLTTLGIWYVLSPVFYSSYTIPYLLFFSALALLFLFHGVTKILLRKRMFAIFTGAGFLIIFTAGVNDILHSQGFINTFFFLPIAIFTFSIIHALSIARKFSNAFSEIELLSNKLKDINKNQKDIIGERTALLNMQAQELQKSNLIKDRVFSIIAHDLRAPIKSLSTVLNWFSEDDLTYEELKKSLGGISKNVDTLNLTLENLLQWSRSQLNGVKSEPELLDIRILIQGMADLYKIQLNEKNLSFNNQVIDMKVVYFDKHQLNLIFRNLISNAIKFTNVNGNIEVYASNPTLNKTLICIKDSGLGMNQEAIRKVFSAVDHYTTFGTNNEKGTGLGLLLCKEYIMSGNGKIWIESELNVGTSVFFELPNQV
jgi:signal transduction histidine kinase